MKPLNAIKAGLYTMGALAMLKLGACTTPTIQSNTVIPEASKKLELPSTGLVSGYGNLKLQSQAYNLQDLKNHIVHLSKDNPVELWFLRATENGYQLDKGNTDNLERLGQDGYLHAITSEGAIAHLIPYLQSNTTNNQIPAQSTQGTTSNNLTATLNGGNLDDKEARRLHSDYIGWEFQILGKTVSSGKSIASTSDYKPGEFLINYNQTNNEDGIINDQSGTSNRIFGGFFQGTLEDFKIRLNGREGMRTDNRLTRKDLGLENIVEISEEENSVLPYNTASTTGNETTMNIVFMTQEDYTKYNTWIASQTDNGQPMVPVGTTNDQPVQGTTSNDPNYFQNGTLDYMMPQEPRKELQNTEK